MKLDQSIFVNLEKGMTKNLSTFFVRDIVIVKARIETNKTTFNGSHISLLFIYSSC